MEQWDDTCGLNEDRADMLGKIASLTQQILYEPPEDIPVGTGRLDNVLIVGMGGSSISGHIIKAQADRGIGIPVRICQGRHIPFWAGENTLVIAVSYSGNTEETIGALNEAARCGCICCISSGGKLEEIARTRGYGFVSVPQGYPPRTALGFMYSAIAHVFSKMGLMGDLTVDKKRVSRMLQKQMEVWGPAACSRTNGAKAMAARLVGKIPVILVASELLYPCARRWKTQFNENSKVPCYTERFPELSHNEIMAWSENNISHKMFHVVIIREQDGHGGKVDFVRDFISGKTSCEVVEVPPLSDLGKIMYLVLLGDLVSTYLALLYGLDPTGISAIEKLKSLPHRDR